MADRTCRTAVIKTCAVRSYNNYVNNDTLYLNKPKQMHIIQKKKNNVNGMFNGKQPTKALFQNLKAL